MLEFLLNKIFCRIEKVFSFSCRFSHLSMKLYRILFDALPIFWKDSINFSILSSFICSFLTHLSKFLWILSSYSIVKFHVPSSSSVSLHPRVFYARLGSTSLDFGAAHCAVVGLDGLEPSTSRLSGARSSHLSYRPVFLIWLYGSPSVTDSVRRALSSFLMKGIEPLTRQSRVVRFLATFSFSNFALHRLRCWRNWWRWRESNPWPPACRAGALPAELHPHFIGFVLSGLFLSNPDNWTTKNFHTTEYTSAWVLSYLTTSAQLTSVS